jgi:hypothetical protein
MKDGDAVPHGLNMRKRMHCLQRCEVSGFEIYLLLSENTGYSSDTISNRTEVAVSAIAP